MESKVLCFHSKDKDIVELKIIFVPGTYSQEHVPGTNFKIFLKFNLSFQWESKGIQLHNLKIIGQAQMSNIINFKASFFVWECPRDMLFQQYVWNSISCQLNNLFCCS